MANTEITIEVLENKKACNSMHYLRTTKPENFSFLPGQYISAKTENEKNVYLALASHPTNNYLEFLINKANFAGSTLCRKVPGDTMSISEPIGPGFITDDLKGKTIYLITHGSGLSAIKPLIEEIRMARENYGSVRFLYGVRTKDDFPLPDLLHSWMGSIEYYDIISQDPKDKSIWNADVGYVQDILKRIAPKPDNSIAIVIGSKEFDNDIKEILNGFGFRDDQILDNIK